MSERDWLRSAQGFFDSFAAEQLLDWALHRFEGRIALASAFGPEGMVLIDMAVRLRRDVSVFTLDTGLFFPETYELIDEVENRYEIAIERLKPALTVDEQAAQYGPSLWQNSPDQCCYLRKVEPLRKKLTTLDAWISAIRRDQTSDRAHTQKLEWDSKFGLVKINPLCDWTSEMVWDYIRSNDLPYNRLHGQGYPSIGCEPCTRPVQDGDDPRAGRWAGLEKTECGLHQRRETNVLGVIQE